MGQQEEIFVIGAVLANLLLYMHEVCQEIRDVFGHLHQLSVAYSTLTGSQGRSDNLLLSGLTP